MLLDNMWRNMMPIHMAEGECEINRQNLLAQVAMLYFIRIYSYLVLYPVIHI